MRKRFWGLLAAVCVVSGTLTAGSFSFVAPTGAGARHQAALDLEHPAVVMSVAAEPGEEDLPTLAALRMGRGARVVTVYVTDGGATPSDINGDLPLFVAARKKSEADGVMRAIGGEAFFLGFPDYGCVSTKANLERLWNRDSLLARLVLAIRVFRPDVILCAADSRAAAGDTARARLIRELLTEASGSAGGGMGPGAWTVTRILEETLIPGSAPALDIDALQPVLKKSFRAIAIGAGSLYRSLRYTAGLWNEGRSRTYRYILGGRGKEDNLTGGLPVLPAALRAASADVARAADDSRKGADEEALRSVSRAIARVEGLLASGRGSLGSMEKRLLLRWKDRLEDLRCAILGVDLTFSASDTLVSRRQQFTVRFAKNRKFPATGRSEILFPSAMDSSWFINRSEGFRFSFSLPDTLEFVTPEDIAFDRPVATTGSARFTLDTRVPFVVAHRDTNPLRNFALRREIVLGVSAVQTAEVITPFLRVTPGERLVLHLQNVSRDPYRGTVFVGDSVADKSQIAVLLRRNENARRDTLPLAWKEGLRDGDYAVEIHVGKGKPVGTFTARKFPALADTSRPVGLLTGLAGSPVAEALRRLHIGYRLIDGSFPGDAPAGLRTILIDRDAFGLRSDGAGIARAIEKWVRTGGHCVILRQDPRSNRDNPLMRELSFGPGHVVPPESPVAGDSTGGVLSAPNRLSAADWSGWIVSRALSGIAAGGAGNIVVHLRDGESGLPLVASARAGEGMITAVALDLVPQLQIVHPGAYRLLANLVSY